LLKSDETRKRLESEGADVIRMTPTEFGRFIGEETQKWGKVVKQAGIQPE
jgi:tripartite-type tricarboxylate transporter receptor subunit TctC